jgi:hypothetical protein
VVFGTPHYMSPEQASGGAVDERTDIYALGVVMYQMFTGHVPFEADTYMGVLTKHLYVAPTPPSVHLGGMAELGALEAVVLNCLEKRPERRYKSMARLGEELARVAKFTEEGVFSVEPANEGTRTSPGLANQLELPSEMELKVALARAGIPERGLSAPAVAGLLALAVACAVAVGVLIVRARGQAAAPSASAAPSVSARAAPVALKAIPTPAVPDVAPLPAEPVAANVTNDPEPTAASAHAERPLPHVGKKAKVSPTSSPKDSIKQRKTESNGIVNPWKQ